MELFRFKKDIPFMRHALIFNAISALTFVAAVFFLLHNGLNLSIEFTGGTQMEVSYPHAANVEQVKQTLEQLGFHDTSASIFGRAQDVLIRLPAPKTGVTAAQQTDVVLAALQQHDAGVIKQRVEIVGPQVGEELWTNGLSALAMVVVGVAIYLAIRFEWK